MFGGHSLNGFEVIQLFFVEGRGLQKPPALNRVTIKLPIDQTLSNIVSINISEYVFGAYKSLIPYMYLNLEIFMNPERKYLSNDM